jgi:hypothetical protein
MIDTVLLISTIRFIATELTITVVGSLYIWFKAKKG